MRQIRSKASISHSAIDPMTIDAGGLLENQTASGRARIVLGQLLLLLDPAVEFLARIHINAEQHLCMLGATVLGALAEKQSGALRLNPHRVYFIRDEVRLAGQARYPEAVHNVCRAQVDEGWHPVATLTHRHVKFICRYNAQLGIPNLPPPLMSDHLNIQRGSRLARVLHFLNYSRRSQGKDKHDEKRHRRPCRLNGPAPVNLRWFGSVIIGPAAETNNRIHEQRSEEHTSELQSPYVISYAVFCLKK